MSRALAAELLKLRTTRTFVTFVAAALALSLLVVTLTVTLGGITDEDSVRAALFSDFSSAFIVILGIVNAAGEWRHRTITGSVLATPDRAQHVVAKAIAHVIAGVLLSLVVTLLVAAVATALLAMRDEPTLGISGIADVLWRNLVIAAFMGALGTCVGFILRNQIPGIIGVLFLGFVLEPALLFLTPEVARLLPIVGLPTGVTGGFGDEEFEEMLSPAGAILAMLAWVAVTLAAAIATLCRRDLT